MLYVPGTLQLKNQQKKRQNINVATVSSSLAALWPFTFYPRNHLRVHLPRLTLRLQAAAAPDGHKKGLRNCVDLWSSNSGNPLMGLHMLSQAARMKEPDWPFAAVELAASRHRAAPLIQRYSMTQHACLTTCAVSRRLQLKIAKCILASQPNMCNQVDRKSETPVGSKPLSFPTSQR